MHWIRIPSIGMIAALPVTNQNSEHQSTLALAKNRKIPIRRVEGSAVKTDF